MSNLLTSIRRHASDYPSRIALTDGSQTLAYGQLEAVLDSDADYLGRSGIAAIALLADNGIPWALADLAALCADIPCVPMPLFFSPQQMLHAIIDSGVDGLLTDRPAQAEAMLTQAGLSIQAMGELHGLQLFRLSNHPGVLPQGTAKITYTSGTTGEPKGVCLGREHMETVTASLLEASAASPQDRHLCLTPLSTLLENVGGIYVPLMAGATCCIPSLATVGLTGASGLDAGRMARALHDFDASTAILAPQMLQALVVMIGQGMPRPPHLRFLAVGGAPVSPQLLDLATSLNIAVFEGYGLSECASVVALNGPGGHRCGTAGRLLPHVEVSFADDGEIMVDSPAFLGYLGQGLPVRPWPTGDIGYLDADGYLHITGRKKSMFITAFGRNVAPEWVERELTLHPAIAQAAVFGEGKPWNCAVIVPRTVAEAIPEAVARINRHLPDYARITRMLIATEPFSPANGQLTINGRLRRPAIMAAYASRIDILYQEETHDVL